MYIVGKDEIYWARNLSDKVIILHILLCIYFIPPHLTRFFLALIKYVQR